MLNHTEVGEFIFLGLTDIQGLQYFFFISFLLLYLTSVLGNGVIVTMLISQPWLHTLMYFFLGKLSFLDVFYSTVTVPKMLTGFLFGHQPISFGGCLAQLYFFHFLGSTETVLLAPMAYDRYMAICSPLCYTLDMNLSAAGHSQLVRCFCTCHVAFSDDLSTEFPWAQPYFFCNIKPLLKLACSSTSLNMTLLYIVTTSIAVGPFILVVLSYLCIIIFLFSDLWVRCQECRWKPFSTCAYHLTVVALLYIPLFFNYTPLSSSSSAKRDMQVSVLYSAITPALNTSIYTLRNQEVRSTLNKKLGRKLFWWKVARTRLIMWLLHFPYLQEKRSKRFCLTRD